MEGVYLTLWFDAKKLRNFLIQFKQSSGECSRGVLYTAQKKCLVAARQQGTEGVLYTYIGVGLSALLVSTGWAMREP